MTELLEPISDENLCGEDLSFSPEFDRIQEARREDDSTVDYGEWQSALKQAEWPMVIASCTDLLRTRSKDLRLSAWLAEANVKTRGLPGLRDGIELTFRLIERFGSEVHPQGEDGDHERRIGTLSWLVMRLAQLVRQIPLTQSKIGLFCLNDYESAILAQNQSQRSGEVDTNSGDRITLEKFTAAVAKTDRNLYIQWVTEAEQGCSSLAKLAKASDDLFGLDGPSFSPLKNSLDVLSQHLRMIAKERGIVSPQSAGNDGRLEMATSKSPDTASTIAAGESIRTRAQALDLLRQVAIFFRNTEPHSPVAYLAEKAAHWGDMPLHSWLRHVVKDNGTLSHIEELLGLHPQSEQGT